MTTETVSVTPPPLLAVSRDDIRAALMQWIIDSRTGDNATRSYAETATLPVDQLADEGADRLWQMLESQGVQLPLIEGVQESITPLVGAEFVAGEDIVAGQIVTFNDAAQVVGIVKDLAATVNEASAVLAAEQPVLPGFFNV